MVNTNVNLDISTTITSNFVLGVFFTLLLIIGYTIYAISKDPSNNWRWRNLISDNTGKGSLTRTLQLIGGLTGTFVVIFQTVKSSLSVEIFGIYMAALGVSEAFTKFISVKYGTPSKSEDKDQ